MKKRHLKFALKGIATSTLIATLFIQVLYVAFEPGKAKAAFDDDQILVTLTVDSGISITSPADCALTPNISVSSNSAICGSTWNVKTNHATGYTLAIKAQASPALVSGGNSFADYTPAVAATPELWSVGSGAKEFGYSVYGTDSSTATWGTSASCGAAGVPAVAQKYRDTTTSDVTVATRAVPTPFAGIDTTFCGAAAQNGIYAASGSYQATITATATEI